MGLSRKLVDSHSQFGRPPVVAQTQFFLFSDSNWLAPLVIHLLCSWWQEHFSLLLLLAFFSGETE